MCRRKKFPRVKKMGTKFLKVSLTRGTDYTARRKKNWKDDPAEGMIGARNLSLLRKKTDGIKENQL